jgi:tripartite-type tricarboxylate transporter receptor subunit TctC
LWSALVAIVAGTSLAFGTAGVALAAEPAPGSAARPITLVVPVPPGGSIDFTARVLQERLPDRLGQPVVVDNKPGASGSIAGAYVAKAAPDGQTVLLAFDTHATNPMTVKDLPYDTFRDFAPVSRLVAFPLVFGVPASVPANTLREFVDQAKANPGKWNYGTAGTGTLNHLGVELFKSQTGIELVHVPYKGGAPALQGMIAGDVQLFLGSYIAIAPQVKAGKAKILAVASARKYAVAPELPTAAEAGFPRFQVSTWIGAFVPAGTPAPVIARLNEAFRAALSERDVRERMAQQGLEVVAGSPEELGVFVRAEHDRWAEVVRRAQIRFD